MGRKRNDNERTEHGENLIAQIQTTDAYGGFNTLTAADLWGIIDNLNTHFLDHGQPELANVTGKWMTELMVMFPAMETV